MHRLRQPTLPAGSAQHSFSICSGFGVADRRSLFFWTGRSLRPGKPSKKEWCEAPHFLEGVGAAGVAQTRKIDDSRPAQKPCIQKLRVKTHTFCGVLLRGRVLGFLRHRHFVGARLGGTFCTACGSLPARPAVLSTVFQFVRGLGWPTGDP